MTQVKNIPKLRFPEFSNNWSEKHLYEIMNDFIVPMRDKPTDLTGEIPWCRIEDFDGIYLSKSKSNQGVSLQTIKSMNLKVYPKNTVLVSCSANLGVCAIVKNPLITNQTFIGLVPNQEVVPEYIYYMMKLSARKLNILSTGTTISYLSREQFEKFKIHIPKTEEQQKIASFLTSVDDKINLLTKKKELLEQYKKGVMQKIFSQEIRFQDDNGNDFPDWEENKLDDIFDAKKGQGLSGKNIVDNGINKCILYGALYTKYNEVILDVIESTNEDGAVKSKIGDLLVPASTTTNGIDLANFTALNENGVLLGGDITILRFKNVGDNIFWAYYLTHYKKFEVAKYAQGSTIVHIYFTHFKKVAVKEPSVVEQQKISSFIYSLDKKIELVESHIEKTKEFKKGLLQQMFV